MQMSSEMKILQGARRSPLKEKKFIGEPAPNEDRDPLLNVL